nr:response regulator [Paracoccus liaowanqingii]
MVLVVEDEPLLRMAALAMVEEAGFQALAASDCEMAVRVLNTCSDIAVVFTDVDLGYGKDGLWLASQIAERWPAVRIIVTSGYRHVTPERVPAGAIFFEKPYSEEKVVDEMRKFVGQ